MFFGVSGLFAQYSDGQTVDKIIAVVGNEAILQSDLESYLQNYAQQNKSINVNDPQIRAKVLDELINEKLVIIKAQEDSISVSDEEITQKFEFNLQNMIDQVGSEKRVEDIYGMSISAIKREFREETRKQLLYEKMRQEKFGDVKSSAREVAEFFKDIKDSIPTIPAEVEIAHILKYVVTSASKKDEMMTFAHKIRDSILKGASFEEMAKKYSGDPGSATSGGELGWFDKGKLVPEFEKAAYALQPGEISLPVESPFGLHIIKLMEKKKESINTKHILLKIGQSSDDIDNAKNFLLDIKKKAANGESFDSLAKKYSEEKETQGFGGVLGKVDISILPYGMKEVVEKMKEGDISEPLQYDANPSKPAYHIIQRRKEIPSHKASLEQDYKRVEQLSNMYKQNRLYQEWIETLRKTIYWEKKGE